MVTDYFFENFQTLLDSKKLSQLAFSKKINTPQGTINKWFNRKSIPPADKIEVISQFFGVQPHYFFMKPGTQTSVQKLDTAYTMDSFIDDIAVKHLTENELQLYRKAGGVTAFIERLRDNYETDKVTLEDWYLVINSELKKYVTLDIVDKVKKILGRETTHLETSNKTNSA